MRPDKYGSLPESAAPAQAELAVSFKGGRKAFGTATVLDDVMLDVPTGQKLFIIGPSGSGKTTLLRTVMTLETLDHGEIAIFGEPMVSTLRPTRERDLIRLRGNIGMVFQHFYLFPHMTVMENLVEAPRRVLKMAPGPARQEAMNLLEEVGMADKSDSYPRTLSGGQQQRVAIARALAMHPKIMLFDEITSALDPELVGEVLNVVRRLAADRQTTMIFVTHEMGFAKETADRVVFMDRGRIVEDDVPDVVFNNPRSPRTKQFLRAVIDR